jgi:hypothetical protein
LAIVWQILGTVAMCFCAAALFSAKAEQVHGLFGGVVAGGFVLVAATIARYAISLRREILRLEREL